MGTSFVAYKDNGFWTPDFIPSTIAGLLLAELSKQNHLADWVDEFRQRMVCAACGYWGGFTTLEFDEYITDKPRVELLLWLLENIRKDVENRANDIIFMSEFDHLFGNDDRSCWPQGAGIYKQVILQALHYIVQILNGTQVNEEPNWDY